MFGVELLNRTPTFSLTTITPFRAAVPFWGQTIQFLSNCPWNGTAVLEGLITLATTPPRSSCKISYIAYALLDPRSIVCAPLSGPKSVFLGADVERKNVLHGVCLCDLHLHFKPYRRLTWFVSLGLCFLLLYDRFFTRFLTTLRVLAPIETGLSGLLVSAYGRRLSYFYGIWGARGEAVVRSVIPVFFFFLVVLSLFSLSFSFPLLSFCSPCIWSCTLAD